MTQREYISWFVAFQIGDIRNVSTATADFISAGLLSFYEKFDTYAVPLTLLFDKSMERMKILFSPIHYTASPARPDDILIFTLLAILLAHLPLSQFRALESRKEDFLCRYKETDFYKNRLGGPELSISSLFHVGYYNMENVRAFSRLAL